MRLNDPKGKEERVIEADTLLVAVGRQGNIEDIGLEEARHQNRRANTSRSTT